MQDSIFYILINISIISSFIFSYVAIYHTERLIELMRIAFQNGRISDTEFADSPISPNRVWRIAFVIISIIGFWFLFYGAMILAFHWIPHGWRAGEGDEVWAGKYLAVIIAFFCWLLFMVLGEKIIKKIQKLNDLEEYQNAIKLFEEGLTCILTHPKIATDFWIEHAERILAYQQSQKKIDYKETNQ